MSFCDVSIVMLAHNGANFTRHALDSILAAKTKPWEIFLVDNASEDETPDLIKHYLPLLGKAGIECQTWRNQENLGCSLARNQAWEKASSKYTILMDNDAAVCTSDWLARLIKHFDQNPKLGILGAKMIYPYKPHHIQCAGVSINRV